MCVYAHHTTYALVVQLQYVQAGGRSDVWGDMVTVHVQHKTVNFQCNSSSTETLACSSGYIVRVHPT